MSRKVKPDNFSQEMQSLIRESIQDSWDKEIEVNLEDVIDLLECPECKTSLVIKDGKAYCPKCAEFISVELVKN